jgi:hypothetical protein
MPKFNTSFKLDLHDIDLIETALHTHKKNVSLQRLALLSTDTGAEPDRDTLNALDTTLTDIHTLLGRLHNQKLFFRPDSDRKTPYISG